LHGERFQGDPGHVLAPSVIRNATIGAGFCAVAVPEHRGVGRVFLEGRECFAPRPRKGCHGMTEGDAARRLLSRGFRDVPVLHGRSPTSSDTPNVRAMPDVYGRGRQGS
jgi:hypothetical protein